KNMNLVTDKQNYDEVNREKISVNMLLCECISGLDILGQDIPLEVVEPDEEDTFLGPAALTIKSDKVAKEDLLKMERM
ncbi:hypothetical protein L9F63_007917, partial [Diploptera punctata]